MVGFDAILLCSLPTFPTLDTSSVTFVLSYNTCETIHDVYTQTIRHTDGQISHQAAAVAAAAVSPSNQHTVDHSWRSVGRS